MKHTRDLYFRVRGPKNDLSEVRRFAFVRLEPPSVMVASPGRKPIATIKFGANAKGPRRWLQIAPDPEFKGVFVNESSLARPTFFVS